MEPVQPWTDDVMRQVVGYLRDADLRARDSVEAWTSKVLADFREACKEKGRKMPLYRIQYWYHDSSWGDRGLHSMSTIGSAWCPDYEFAAAQSFASQCFRNIHVKRVDFGQWVFHLEDYFEHPIEPVAFHGQSVRENAETIEDDDHPVLVEMREQGINVPEGYVVRVGTIDEEVPQENLRTN